MICALNLSSSENFPSSAFSPQRFTSNHAVSLFSPTDLKLEFTGDFVELLDFTISDPDIAYLNSAKQKRLSVQVLILHTNYREFSKISFCIITGTGGRESG